MSRRRSFAPALLILGVIALLRALYGQPSRVAPEDVGEPVDVRLAALSGDGFRLLPGVGPVLARRLEAARLAAGGILTPDDLQAVAGLGPVSRARWEALWVAEPDGVR